MRCEYRQPDASAGSILVVHSEGRQLFRRNLTLFRDCIRSRQYLVSVHAAEEMRDDELTMLDVENCILTGEVIERQLDAQTDEWKYVVRGYDFGRRSVTAVVKRRPAGSMLIITVFRERESP